MRHVFTRFLCTCAVLMVLPVAGMAQAEPPLTEIADLVHGQEVTLQGVVHRITDEDEFILADASGRVPVYVGPNSVPATMGEAITVVGHVDDDGLREIYARLIIRADGSKVPLSHRY
jgi:hypothetical protein